MSFTLPEFLKTGHKVPSFDQVASMHALVLTVLNPVRTWLGAPIFITSGFRTPEHNTAIKGSSTSQHMCLGPWAAADISTKDPVKNKKIFEYLKKSSIDFDQLIIYRGGAWLHVSYRTDGKNRRQVLEKP